jgi:hypothetical protein
MMLSVDNMLPDSYCIIFLKLLQPNMNDNFLVSNNIYRLKITSTKQTFQWNGVYILTETKLPVKNM